jgi:hypothetical protein
VVKKGSYIFPLEGWHKAERIRREVEPKRPEDENEIYLRSAREFFE